MKEELKKRPYSIKKRAKIISFQMKSIIKEILYSYGFSSEFITQNVSIISDNLSLKDFLHSDVHTLSQKLMNILREKILSCIEEGSFFPLGKVYCFYCKSIFCEHSIPKDGRETFFKYLAVGKPEWLNFELFLTEKDKEKLEKLYGEEKEIIVTIHRGSESKKELTPAIVSENLVYDLIAQFTAGYIPYKVNEQTEKGVLTIHIYRKIFGERRGVLILNPIGEPLYLSIIFSEDENSLLFKINQLLMRARYEINAVERKLKSIISRMDKEEEIFDGIYPVLKRLEDSFLSLFKEGEFRTKHAMLRHLSGERPTGKYLDDIMRAGSEDFFVDERKNTLIVRGGKKRIHIFSMQGKHISSFKEEYPQIERRINKKIWRYAKKEEKEILKKLIR